MKKISAFPRWAVLVLVLSQMLVIPGGQAPALDNFLQIMGIGGEVATIDGATLGQQAFIGFEYKTGVSTVINDHLVCTPVTVENVVITLTLPSQTTFVSEDSGIAVFDADTRTVSWNIGTLDASLGCVSKSVNVVIKADPPLPDGVLFNGVATATISTTTPGDDPAGNTFTFYIQDMGYKPVEFWLTGVNNNCDAATTDPILGTIAQDHQVGSQTLGCLAVGDTAGQAASSALTTPGIYPPETEIKIGELPSNGSPARRFFYSHGSYAFSGFRVTVNDDIPQQAGADSFSSVSFQLRNPNSYAVPLIGQWALSASSECFSTTLSYSLSNASGVRYQIFTPPASSNVLTSPCSGHQNHFGSVYIQNDGGTRHLCTTHLVLDDIPQPDISVSSDNCSFPVGVANGTTNLSLPTEADAVGGFANIGAGAHSAVVLGGVVRGVAQLNTAGFLSFGVSTSNQFSLAPAGLVFKAESPVNMLVTDSVGRKTGFNPDPNGPPFFADIPGSSYSGEQSEPETIMIPFPEAGSYHLDLYGTGDGPFTITAFSQDPFGNELGSQIITGTASSGSHIGQVYTLEDNGTIILGIPLKVYLPIVVHSLSAN